MWSHDCIVWYLGPSWYISSLLFQASLNLLHWVRLSLLRCNTTNVPGTWLALSQLHSYQFCWLRTSRCAISPESLPPATTGSSSDTVMDIIVVSVYNWTPFPCDSSVCVFVVYKIFEDRSHLCSSLHLPWSTVHKIHTKYKMRPTAFKEGTYRVQFLLFVCFALLFVFEIGSCYIELVSNSVCSSGYLPGLLASQLFILKVSRCWKVLLRVGNRNWSWEVWE